MVKFGAIKLMTTIYEKEVFGQTPVICTCDKQINDFYWEVNGEITCNDCYKEYHSHLVKCCMDDCDEYEPDGDLIDSMCASCYELNSPLSDEDQEGWEHNIEKWNDL
ncbi:hypothetical protein [Aliivibrio fischeri]|uniref:hypothetical protein n=1 Tax=Aliivibrio fischeri TaxID=668 RepID=UPI0007C4A768|nr:hypothetical protein [Aliivibrio fischeri]